MALAPHRSGEYSVAKNSKNSQPFLTDVKTKWNGHLSQAGVHLTNDPQAITAPTPVDLQTSMDLANTYRAVFATHIQHAFPGSFIQVIDP